jgi:hypothetical protein
MKKRSKNIFKQIIVWVIIFVLAGLILNFATSPMAKNFISDTFSVSKNSLNLQKETINYIKIEMPVSYEMYSIDRCSALEIAASQEGMSGNERKAQVCTYLCGDNDMEYGKFECITDHLNCYCKE